MTVTEYSKTLELTVLNFEGNKITECCKNLLQGLLEKNINKRFSYDLAINHPWIILIQEKIDDITNKFQYDPEKMISQLNNTLITDNFFNNENYIDINVEKELENVKKKRKNGRNTNKNIKITVDWEISKNNTNSDFTNKKRYR